MLLHPSEQLKHIIEWDHADKYCLTILKLLLLTTILIETKFAEIKLGYFVIQPLSSPLLEWTGAEAGLFDRETIIRT
jgi:hypothetical protein